MSWATILEKIVHLQKSERLCVVKNLSAHDIVMRLMRKENYLIGMVNKGVLTFPISKWVPGAGSTVKYGADGTEYRLILPRTLELALHWCILQSMFDRYVNYSTNFMYNHYIQHHFIMKLVKVRSFLRCNYCIFSVFQKISSMTVFDILTSYCQILNSLSHVHFYYGLLEAR